jgi:hypothetical protein
MTNAEMENLFVATFDHILKLRRLKSREYSEDGDALSNFRRNGRDLELPMEAVWRVYAMKHWDAISQYIRDRMKNAPRELSEPIEGRIDDLIVYLILFKAMIMEHQD